MMQSTLATFIKYGFLFLALFFLAHLVYVFFSSDINLQLSSIFIDIIFIGLSLMAIIKLEYAFFLSLLLLPLFFLLENVSIINQIYNSQSLASLSVYAVDPRTIGFSIAIFMTWLIIIKNKNLTLSKIPVLKIMLATFIFFLLSSFWSVGHQEKYVQVSFYFLLLSLYIITYNSIKSLSSFQKLMSFLIIISLPAILMAYFQIFGGLFFEYADMDIKRVSGPFNSPNLLGSFILVTTSLAMILIRTANKSVYKNYLISYLSLALPIFFLTFSRSAWIGIIVFVAFFSLQSKRFIFASSLVFILLFSLMLTFESTRERVSGFSERTMFDSVYARTNIWRMSYKKFTEKPIIGYGAGSFSEVINDAKESAGGTDNPHNDLVFFSIEGGIVGVLGFLGIVLSFYYYLIKYHIQIKYRKINKSGRLDKNKLYVVSLGVLSLFISMTVVSMVESYYEGNFLHLFIWSLLGGWFALAKIELNKIEKQ